MSLLAVGISFRRKRDYALQNERAADAARITSRIDSLPVSIDAKAQICATAASSKYAYGLEFGPASLEALAPLTVAVKKAIWNRSLKFPLEELLHTLPFKGWSIHPHMQWVAQTLMRVRRILAQYAELRPPFAEVWEAFSQTNEVMYCTRFGLIATVARVVQDVGWQWPEPFTIVTDWGMRIDFLSVDPGFWEHEVRRATRRMMWQTLSTRLPKYLDVQGGIDTWATLRVFKSRDIIPYERGFLRTRPHCHVTASGKLRLFARPHARCVVSWRPAPKSFGPPQLMPNCVPGLPMPRGVATECESWSSVERSFAAQPESRELLAWRCSLGPPSQQPALPLRCPVRSLSTRTLSCTRRAMAVNGSWLILMVPVAIMTYLILRLRALAYILGLTIPLTAALLCVAPPRATNVRS